MKRKLLSVFLSLAMVLTMMPVFAMAEETPSVEEGSTGVDSGSSVEASGIDSYDALGGKTLADEIAPVARVGSVEYGSLQAAVDAANNGDIVTLINNTNQGFVVPADLKITFDVNGKNLERGGQDIQNNGTLTIRDNTRQGKIISKGDVAIGVGDNSNTTIEYANVESVEGAVITGYATGATITIKDGEFNASDNAVIAGNGSKTNSEGKMREKPNTINILGGTFNGKIKSPNYVACGIYAPWNDKITVNGGTFDIKGGAGIVARAGNVTITGGEFKTTTNNTTVKNGIGRVGDSRVVVPCSALVFDSEANYPALTVDSNIAVTGGTFTSEVDTVSFIKKDTDNNNRIVISGGTFSSDVTKHCVENYVTEKNNGNTYIVKPLKDVAVAQIGENGFYKTIEDAVDKANDGDTVKLLKDIELNDLCPIKKNITLDLGDKTLSRNGSILDIYGNVTIKNGKIKIPPSEEETGAVWVNKTAKLTVENSVTIDVPDNSFAIGYWSDCTTAEVNFKGSITGGNGITMNGMITDTNTNNILILDGAKINVKGHGVYQAGYSKTSFSANNSEIRGVTGIEVRAGDLTVTNSIISGSNDKAKFSCKPNGNGTTTDGVGIAIAQHTTKLPINVTISGGEISGAYAIYESNPQKNEAESVKKVTLSVNDGKFTGDIYSEDITGFISGGHFTSDPTDYLVKDKVAGSSDINGYAYKVVEKTEKAKPAESEVTSVPVKTIKGADKTTEEAAKEVKGVAVDQSSANIIDAATKDLANKNTIEVTNDTTVVDSLKKLTGDNTLTKDNITLVYQSYIDVTVKEAVKSGDTEESKKFTELTVDLTPMYRVVATKKDNVTNNKEIIIEGETANAVVVKSAEKLDLKNVSYNVSLVLPREFAENNAKLSIKHVKDNGSAEYYTGTVEDYSGTLIVNFTTNGFSPFTVYAESAAFIDDTLYPTLQTAVDAVKDGQTITVTKDTKSASVSGDKSFIIKTITGVSKVMLTAASGYNLTNDGNGKYTVSPKHSSGSSTTTYTVTVGSVSNGTVTSSHKSAASGATVTLTVKPADGYAVEAVTAKDAKGNAVKVTEKDGKYTFAMPASNVTVSASFVKKGEQPAAKLFDDVAQGAYYYDAVKWAVDKGVTNGKTSNLFGADDPCTRAQIVTFLWRAAGSPAASASVSFTDVKDSDYYAKAVAWAVEKGITNGTGDGKFSSDDTCTRAQCAAFLYRAAGSPEVTDAAAFSDVAADAYYAKAVAWAEKNGITNGLGNGKFGSDNSCTRAQIITFLYRTYQGK